MGAFFAAPGMLAFAGLAFLPIIIHLLNRQRYKRVRWAAMEFLLTAYKKTYKRLRLENLLLLILRTAAVLLAALALAQPHSAGGETGFLKDPVSALLLVDDSMSMGARVGGVTRMDLGKAQLKKLVERLPGRSRITLDLASRPAEPLLTDASPEEALELLAGLKPSDLPCDLVPALGQAAALLRKAVLTRREMAVLTDLQASSWTSRGTTLDPELAALVKEKVPVRILDVGEGQAENAALLGLRVVSKVPVAGRPIKVEGRLRNFGTGARQDLEVQLLVDGVARDRQVLPRLDAQSEATVALFATLPEPGPYALELKLSEDALPLDDHRWLGLRARAGMEVLVVDGDPKPSPEDCEGYFLSPALAPKETRASIRVTERSILRFGPQEDLRAYDAVFLLNVSALTPEMAERMGAYVKEGGHLVVSLGSNTVAGEWNERCFQEGKGFLPVKVGEVRGPSDPAEERFATLQVADPNHLAAASLKASRTVGAINIRRFLACEPLAAPDVRVPWRFRVKDQPEDLPAVVERPYGAGRVLVVATALDKEWGDLPSSLTGEYLALVRDLLYAAVQGAQGLEVAVGRPVSLDLGGEHAGAALRVVAPDETTERVAPEPPKEGGNRLSVTTAPLVKAGPYRLAKGNPEEVLERFAANPAAQESDLARITPEALKAALPDLPLEILDASAKETKGAGGREFWRPLLTAVAIILALESLLAWRFGRT